MNSVASQSSSAGWVGGAPWEPKVVLRLDQAAAEVLLPDAVDHDARGQRVGGVEEPAGEVESVGLCDAQGRQDGGRAGCDRIAGPGEVALDEEAGVPGRREFVHHQG
jgi:hypothetical protein